MAEAFQVEGLVAVDDRDCETRHVARIDGLLRQRFERRQTRLDLRTGDSLAECASGTARDDAERDTDRRDVPMGSKPLHLIVDPIKDGSGIENRAKAAPKLIAATSADKPISIALIEGGSNWTWAVSFSVPACKARPRRDGAVSEKNNNGLPHTRDEGREGHCGHRSRHPASSDRPSHAAMRGNTSV
ncbi:hypothetical protein [Methylorubrum extorquens]